VASSSRLARTILAALIWAGFFFAASFSMDGWTRTIAFILWLAAIGVATLVVRDKVLVDVSRRDMIAQLVACYVGGVLYRGYALGLFNQVPDGALLWVFTGVWPAASLAGWTQLANVGIPLIVVGVAGYTKRMGGRGTHDPRAAESPAGRT